MANKPEIIGHRATCIGEQYAVYDSLGVSIVTCNGGFVGCDCGMDSYFLVCSHIRLVERTRATNAVLDAKREIMHSIFDVSNQEMKNYLYS